VFPNLIESDGIYGNAMLQKWLRVQRNLHFLSLVLQASSMHSIIDTWLMILVMISDVRNRLMQPLICLAKRRPLKMLGA